MKMFRGINGRAVRSDFPIGLDQLRDIVPSVFAADKHESRSDRYAYIPTCDVLQGLMNEGFEVFMAAQGKSRIPGKAEFTKHILRMRHRSQVTVEGHSPEILLLNSHDGTSCYRMISGVFRFVCANGMVHGDVDHDVRVRHSGDPRDEVIEGAYRILDHNGEVMRQVGDWAETFMSPAHQTALAAGMLAYKYGTEEETGESLAPVSPQAVLQPRRYDDKGDSLWLTFNRLQENLMKGGIHGRNPETRRRVTTRPVTGVDSDMKLNRALWVMAETLRNSL